MHYWKLARLFVGAGPKVVGSGCVLLPMLLCGCMVGPNYRPPRTDVPPDWVGVGAISGTGATTMSTANSAAPDVAAWWNTFNDPLLNSLIERSIESNFNLRQAEARIRQARANRGVVASGLWPTVNTSASYRRSGSDRSSGSGGSAGAGGTTSSGPRHDLYQAGLDASWELDVFGGVRRGIEASEADLAAEVENRRDVLVTLTSEVALNYIDLRGLQQQIAISLENLKAQEYSADLTRRRFRGGLVSALDVANAEAQVATTQSQIPLLQASAQRAIFSLGFLLGREPGALLEELSSDRPLPPIPQEVPVGLPSDLLRRRPDVRRAEAQLHAATARVGVATAELFPRFSLTGAVGLQGNQPKSLLNASNNFWSIGPGVSWPIFDAGRIRASIEVQNAVQEEALLAYQSAVLTSLQDVESALVSYAQEQRHRQALIGAVGANRRAVDLATRLYQQGQTDFLNVLSAQRALYASQDALAQSDRIVATDLIALYKALGGGWEFEMRG